MGAGINRYNPQRDFCEPEIKWVLKHIGCIVYPISAAGVPDLLVSCPFNPGVTYLIECKDADTGRMKPAQIIFNEVWLGQRGTATNWQEALAILETPQSLRDAAKIGYDNEMLKPVSRRFKKKS